jgi:hypothetical protein
MSKYDEYLRQAQYCESMAHKSNTLEARASWLRLSDKWAALAAEKRHPVESENPGAIRRKDGEHKDSSSKD